MRPSGRRFDQLREVSLEPGYAVHAEGSCFVKFGRTHVLCTASLESGVPPFLKGSGKGWVTAEYGMLPRSTGERMRAGVRNVVRRDELDAAWQWIDPIHAAWTASSESPKTYSSGTWGPTASSALIVRDGLSWKEET
jgi:hypothetical protein